MNYVTGDGTTFSRDDMAHPTRFYRMNYPSNYKTDNLYITKWEKDNSSSSMTYQFIGAFPLSIVSMPVSYEGSSVLKCSASFSYIRYIRRRSTTAQAQVGIVVGVLSLHDGTYQVERLVNGKIVTTIETVKPPEP